MNFPSSIAFTKSLFPDLPRMKAEQSLSAIFRQLRPCLSRSYAHPCRLRHFSQLAASGHPFGPKPQLEIAPKIQSITPPQNSPLRNLQVRHQSSASTVVASVPTAPEAPTEASSEKPPAYELTFTCKPCSHRSTHNVSKQGYHKGTVLITCPDCKNRHLISDHLKIFVDKSLTIEDLMREKGQLVKRGHLGGHGDVEFWDDGTSNERRVDASQ